MTDSTLALIGGIAGLFLAMFIVLVLNDSVAYWWKRRKARRFESSPRERKNVS